VSDSKRHLVVYISGPLSAPTNDGWFSHTVKARFACRELWMLGVTPICPHTNSLFMEGVVSYDEFILGDLELVQRSDAVYMIGDWEKSKGAQKEYRHAAFSGMPVFYTLDNLKTWVEKQPLDNAEKEQ